MTIPPYGSSRPARINRTLEPVGFFSSLGGLMGGGGGGGLGGGSSASASASAGASAYQTSSNVNTNAIQFNPVINVDSPGSSTAGSTQPLSVPSVSPPNPASISPGGFTFFPQPQASLYGNPLTGTPTFTPGANSQPLTQPPQPPVINDGTGWETIALWGVGGIALFVLISYAGRKANQKRKARFYVKRIRK